MTTPLPPTGPLSPGRLALAALVVALLPSMAWASGKICTPDMSCIWLYRGCIAMTILGAVSIGLVWWRANPWLHRGAMLLGAINLVMGERFFSSPTYDIFYNHSWLLVLQMAIGFLGLALAFLQARRRRVTG